MQDPKEIEQSYQNKVDPWGYKTNPDDAMRKQKLLDIIKKYSMGVRFDRALDIGAGEGWITQDLPADEIYGYEISDTAASRFPKNVNRAMRAEGKYDLIIATGVMYGHYDHEGFVEMIMGHASDLIVLVNIKDWEMPSVSRIHKIADEVYTEEFPYRKFTEKLRVFKIKQPEPIKLCLETERELALSA